MGSLRSRGEAVSRQGNSGSGLKIMYTNAMSVVNKIDELKIYASLSQPDIIAITETRRTRGDCIETIKMLRGVGNVRLFS